MEGADTFRNDPEYQGLSETGEKLHWALDAVKAADAYARLPDGVAPGAGMRITVVDDGIHGLHEEFDPFWRRVNDESGRPADRITLTRLPDAGIFTGDHGTAVTSLILADRHDPGKDTWFGGRGWGRQDGSFHGIAYGASVDVYAIPIDPDRPPPYDVPGWRDTEEAVRDFANGLVGYLRPATERRPHVVNMSFGLQWLTEQFADEAERKAVERGSRPLAEFVAGFDAASTPVFVTAAGNHHGYECADDTNAVGCRDGKLDARSPSFDSALPFFAGDLQDTVGKRWVAVVATDRENRMASFSNRCGLAARWCLAAPGAEVAVAAGGSSERSTADGTSFAAPLVSGGLAVVKQIFGDTLTMEQVLSRVYDTADLTPDTVPAGAQCPAHLDTNGDRSQCELSSHYGRGLMNLERATRPVGGTTGAGRFHDATGGAVTAAVADLDPVVFDSLGYPFAQQGAYATVTAAGVSPIPRFDDEAGNGRPSWSGLRWNGNATAESAYSPWSFAQTSSSGEVHSGGLAYAPEGGSWEAGYLAERNRLFGGVAEGSFAGNGFVHHTGFVHFGKTWTAERGPSLKWSSTIAGARMESSGVLQHNEALYVGHRLAIAHEIGNGRSTLSMEAPLRAEYGTARVKVPVGGTKHDGVRYAERTVDAIPEGREIHLGAEHRRSTGTVEWVVNGGLRLDAGHQDGAEDWHLGAAMQVGF